MRARIATLALGTPLLYALTKSTVVFAAAGIALLVVTASRLWHGR